jgi:hypothetical protein
MRHEGMGMQNEQNQMLYMSVVLLALLGLQDEGPDHAPRADALTGQTIGRSSA